MSIFDHYGLIEEIRQPWVRIKPVKSAEIIINYIKIISFSRVVTQAEIAYQLILSIYILNQYCS